MTDMRNVNNWHWVNKDCRVWAKEYFTKQLVGLNIENKGNRLVITSIDDCTGDVDLNQRKGKLIAIYDIVLKLSWKGELSNGSTAFGVIEIPEVAYDTEFDDYVFNISIKQGKDDIKSLIRTELVPLLRQRLSKFTQDLISRHSEDLYTNKASKPTFKQRKAVSKQPVPIETAKIEQAVRTSQTEHSYDFKGIKAKDIYEALLDSRRADIWSHGKSRVSSRAGSDFQLFDGNIHGKLLKATPYKSIVQTWRFKSWPKGHYSTVTLSLNDNDNGVQVHVSQLGVPLGQEEVIRINWVRYYWDPIKNCYNHGQLRNIPISSFSTNSNYIYVSTVIIIMIIALTAYLVSSYLHF